MQSNAAHKTRPLRQHRLDKGLKGWITNYAKQNYWRVASHYELDDLIQDGYVCYAKCNQRYGHVRDQAHFMALVKTTFYRHITDLANSRTHTVDSPIDTRFGFKIGNEQEDANAMLSRIAGGVPPEGEFACLMGKLPRELAELFSTLLNDAKDIPYLSVKDTRAPNGRFRKAERETRNEYLCRLIGADPKQVNLEAIFRAHFMPA